MPGTGCDIDSVGRGVVPAVSIDLAPLLLPGPVSSGERPDVLAGEEVAAEPEGYVAPPFRERLVGIRGVV